MVVLQSNRFGIQEEKERICKNKMDSEDESKVDSMKEGEASDLDSAKSMGKDEFKVSKQPSKTIPSPTTNFASTPTTMTAATSNTADSSNRYWMKDLYKYGYPRGYPRGYPASGLYNLAWAQAVQNKPLNEVLPDFQKEEGLQAAHGGGGEEEKGARVNSHTIRSSEQIVSDATNGDESGAGGRNVVAIDDEREEGELEEGEIDLDSEVMQLEVKGSICGGFGGTGVEDEELEDRVPLIRKVLENVNTTEAEKSFDVVCARLRSSVESLQQLVLHCWFPSKDALIHQTFMGFKCVNSVFLAMGPLQREQNTNAMIRLVTYVMRLQPALFSPQQMKEIESMVTQITPDNSQRSIGRDNLEQLPVMDKAILTDSNTLSVNSNCEPNSSGSFDINSSSNASDMIDTSKKVGLCLSETKGISISDFVRPSNLPTLKGKSGVGPLLDLHRVHDLDSLPSPTHNDPSQQSDTQMLHFGDVVHPYEKDALRAFSSYQQKFAHRTFLSNELPSPTPSEEGKDGEADDGTEEVSSSFGVSNLVHPVLQHQVVTSAPHTTSLVMQRLISGATAEVCSAGVSPASQATTKSRDPRLRCMYPDSNASDGPAMKKQRNGLEDTGIAAGRKDLGTLFSPLELQGNSLAGPPFVNKSSPVTSVTDPRKQDNLAASGSTPAPVNIGTSTTLQSLLRDISGNPAAWMNVLDEQRKPSEFSKAALDLANSGSLLHSKPISSVASANAASVMGQQAGGLAEFLPVAQRDKSANVRMKPRDPRRILHASIEKSKNSGSHLSIPNDVSTVRMPGVKESLDVHKSTNGTNTSGLPSRPIVLPDIARQFTKSLKNIADIMSVSQAPALPTLSSQAPSEVAQPRSGVNSLSAVPLTSGNQQGEPGLNPEEVTSGPARSWTTWRDVEHLFDGYDEQQKAAIQKERTRRIEEQKKMFSARKLCLVLDLDHTLLNSAKFTEVDPIHDEILRKKEEQDREKPYRHLFCLPHMAMWTKLRPGIWNFLEKASKLYELHLYTMGNKLYANEMAKVLDPKGVLFAGRVISRGNDGDLIDSDERVPKSKDLEGVLGMESAVVIIDDSIRVWPHNKLNLIAVERYIYFPCSRRQFGLPGPSLLEIEHDERAEDGTLAASLSVIERIHANFFSHERLDDVDVRNILAFEQQKILAGCRIVFSRVFPVGEVNPHLHPLWQTAEQFGAVCTNQIDEQVTHVVANSLGTDKVNWAISTGRFVVHPGWVEASALLYRRANELDFAIKS